MTKLLPTEDENQSSPLNKKGNLAQYVNLKEVASGSHSQVYIATDSLSSKTVVIKKLGKEHFPLHRVENEVSLDILSSSYTLSIRQIMLERYMH